MDAPALLVACLVLDESRDVAGRAARAGRARHVRAEPGRGAAEPAAGGGRARARRLPEGRAAVLRAGDPEALDLPGDWQPAFLVLLGYPQEGFEVPPREDWDVGDVMIERS